MSFSTLIRALCHIVRLMPRRLIRTSSPVGTVNYTTSEDFTRITEFKNMTGQVLPGKQLSCVSTHTPMPQRARLITPFSVQHQSRIALEASDALLYSGNFQCWSSCWVSCYYDMDGVAASALELSDELIVYCIGAVMNKTITLVFHAITLLSTWITVLNLFLRPDCWWRRRYCWRLACVMTIASKADASAGASKHYQSGSSRKRHMHCCYEGCFHADGKNFKILTQMTG